MNGIGLLVLLAILGQVNVAPHVSHNHDYGWEFDPRDGALCYIVQVSAEQAQQMQAGGMEKSSDLPVELVGRATRVIFRIGNDELPQVPSLAEINKMPRFSAAADVTAALGPGRISDVEADSLVNVQDNSTGLPRFPASPNTNLNQQAGSLLSQFGNQAQAGIDNLVDQASRASGNAPPSLPTLGGNPPPPANNSAGLSNLVDQFRSGTAGTRPGFAGDASSRSTPMPSTQPNLAGLPSTGPSKFESAPPPTDGSQANDLSSWPTQADPRATGQGPSRLTDQRGYPQPQNGASPYNQGNYESPMPPSLAGIGIPNQQTPVNGFGSTTGVGSRFGNQTGFGQSPGSAATEFNGPGAANGGQALNQSNLPNAYAGISNNGTQTGPGGFSQQTPSSAIPNDGFNRMAANTGSVLIPGQQSAVGKSTDGSASDSQSGASTPARSSQGILQVFLLLSLVVNLYLGMLIHKLLTRYRSLLTSVRGQTT